MSNFAATFDTQLSPIAPFLFYLVIGIIIFIETGLLIGFILPGDSLLFSAGLVASTRDDVNIVILISVIFLAAFIGDQVGYVIGRKLGRPYLERKNSPRMQRMLARSERFYERYGWWSVVIARKHAAVVATGRSDQPNQINNVLVFPGIFRGLLDGNITKITDDMLIRAAGAIASCVSSEQLNANFIVPSVFDQNVVQKVAAAVKKGG